MKIGVVHLGRRGAGVAIAYELTHHLATNAEVFVLVSSQADNIELWRKSDITCMETETFVGWVAAFISVFNVGRFKTLAKQIRAQAPDILLFPMFHLWTAFLQKRLVNIPSIMFVHDPVPHPGLLPTIIRMMEDSCFKRASRCIVFSEMFCKDLCLRGVPMENIEVIPIGELSYYRRMFLSSQASENQVQKKILLFFGRITEYKGLEILLEAFRSYAHRSDIELLIAGEGDISSYAGLLKVLSNVRLVNRFIPEDEVANIFEKADIVVLPYTSATQSGVIPVAAAFKLPVIASRVGGIPEQIVDGKTGLLVEPGSVEQLSAAIERLLMDQNECVRLGNALYEDHVVNRNWSKIAEKLFSICTGVLK